LQQKSSPRTHKKYTITTKTSQHFKKAMLQKYIVLTLSFPLFTTKNRRGGLHLGHRVLQQKQIPLPEKYTIATNHHNKISKKVMLQKSGLTTFFCNRSNINTILQKICSYNKRYNILEKVMLQERLNNNIFFVAPSLSRPIFIAVFKSTEADYPSSRRFQQFSPTISTKYCH
jgi:hypothetical protein